MRPTIPITFLAVCLAACAWQLETPPRLVAAEKNVVAADIVEVMPLPGQVVTEFLAARLGHKLITYICARE